MNDTHVRQAFDQLRSDVTEATDPTDAYRTITSVPAERTRWVALAAAATGVVVLLAVTSLVARQFDGTDVADSTTAPTGGTTVGTSTPTTGEATLPTSGSTSSTTGVTPPSPPAAEVPTHRVANVAADDVLNVRHAPEASAPKLAELAPSYAGVRWTGETATADDGGTWWRIELLDPVAVVPLGEPFHGAISGWVNRAFLAPIAQGLPVDFDQLPCELGPGIGAITVDPEGSGSFAADHIIGMRHAAEGACQRVVITLGSGFSPEFDWELIPTDLRPADQLPGSFLANEDWLTISWSGETGSRLLGARPEAMQLATPDGPVLVTLDEFGTYSVVFTFPVRQPNYRTVPEDGRIIIDYESYQEPVANTQDRLVVVLPPFVADGEVWIDGWARPFEATLGIELTRDGRPAPGTFQGRAILREGSWSENAVMVPAWVDGWGVFHFQVSDLARGDYELFLFSDGADEPLGIRIDFTVP